MEIIDERLNEILTLYKSLRDRFKTELELAPEGRLLHQMQGSHLQFIYSDSKDGKRIRRGINRDVELIKALAKKEFDSKAYEILSHNIAVIEDALNLQIPFDPYQILKSMTQAYALLPEQYFFDRKTDFPLADSRDEDLMAKIKKHEEWWKKPYEEYWGYPEKKTKLTSKGQYVRSVSELLIAEELYKYSIPFHYEEELKVGMKTYAPDFTFEGGDYRMFYLDYMGMMSNAKYAKKNFLKLDDYYDIGLIPGDNLIVAFNSSGIMNVGVIEAIIQNEVIPRL